MNTNGLKSADDPSEFEKGVDLFEHYWKMKCADIERERDRIESEATTKLLRASFEYEEMKKELLVITNERNTYKREAEKQQIEIALTKERLFTMLEHWEAIYDSDESSFDRDRMIEYVDAATFAMRRYDRHKNRIYHVEDKINALPY
jgi:hypothetical protein